jgi:hypothetical protein
MNLNELLAALDAPIVVRPARRMTQGELESYLDTAANILRGNADHSDVVGEPFLTKIKDKIPVAADRSKVFGIRPAGR